MSSTTRILSCPHCGKRFRVRPGAPDKEFRCASCQTPLGESVQNRPETFVEASTVPEPGRPGVVVSGPAPVPPESRGLPSAGDRIGPYRIEARLGEGGMGIVYRCLDEPLRRVVAVKVLRPEVLENKTSLERFQQEAQAIARLNHPNLIRVYAYGIDEDRPYFAMEFVDGVSLDRLIAEGKISLKERLALFRSLVEAVRYAHEEGVIHRDIKPSNVLVDRESKPILTDFGLAREIDRVSRLTQEGVALGTPFYMAPEQLEGKVDLIDARTDIYALGVVLFELVTGTRPFRAKSKGELYYKVLSTDAIVPVRARTEVPEAIQAICLAAMNRDRSLRPRTAREFLRQFDAAVQGRPTRTRIERRAHFSGGPKSRGIRFAAAGTVLLALAGSLLWAFGPWRSPREGGGALAALPEPADSRVGPNAAGGDDEAAVARVETALAADDFDAALAAIHQFDREGRLPRIAGDIGRLLVDQGSPIEELLDRGGPQMGELLAGILRVDEKSFEALVRGWLVLADSKLDANLADQADKWIERVLRVSADHPGAIRIRAKSARLRGDYPRARADLERLCESSLAKEALRDLATLAVELDQDREARVYLDRLVALDPADGGSYLERARFLHDRKEWGDSLGDFTKAKELGVPGTAAMLAMMSEAAIETREFRMALDCETEAERLGKGGGVAVDEKAILARRTRITNLVLEPLASSGELPLEVSFRSFPPAGAARARVEQAWPARLDEAGAWGLVFAVPGESRLSIAFRSGELGRRVILLIDHGTPEAHRAPSSLVEIAVNGRAYVDEGEVAGGPGVVHRKDITELAVSGENVIEWRLLETANKPYWIRFLRIVEE